MTIHAPGKCGIVIPTFCTSETSNSDCRGHESNRTEPRYIRPVQVRSRRGGKTEYGMEARKRLRQRGRLRTLLTGAFWLAMAACVAGQNTEPQSGFTLPVYRTQSPDAPSGGAGVPGGYGGLPPSGPASARPATPEEVSAEPYFAAEPDRPLTSSEPFGVVLSVKVTGNKTVKLTEIMRHIKTRKDRNYDEQLVQEDLRRLYATKKFHNVRPHRTREGNGVHLVFEVLEKPMMDQVLFIGNQYITDKKLMKESGLKPGDALSIYSVQEARRKVEEYYRSKGLRQNSRDH